MLYGGHELTIFLGWYNEAMENRLCDENAIDMRFGFVSDLLGIKECFK